MITKAPGIVPLLSRPRIDLPVDSAVATIHPSAVLRTRDAQQRRDALDGLVRDLTMVAGLLS